MGLLSFVFSRWGLIILSLLAVGVFVGFLKFQIKDLQASNAALQADNQTLLTNVETLKTNLAQNQQVIEKLQSTMVLQKNTIEDYNARIWQLNANLNKFRQDLKDLKITQMAEQNPQDTQKLINNRIQTSIEQLRNKLVAK